MEEFATFVGRFHPIIVHFPIGILYLAFIFELLSRTKRFKKIKFAVEPTLFIGAIGSMGSATSGFLLSQEGGYPERLLDNHQWLGIATTLFSILVWFFHRGTFLLKEKHRKPIRIIVFIPLLLLLTYTGHLGGSLTHGEDFLAPQSSDQTSFKKVSSLAADSNFYKNVIDPLLEKKCYSCHSSKKQKGQLRLDEVKFILAGGKHGLVIKSTPKESELYKRLVLQVNDEHHMPPKGREQFTQIEIDAVYGWIEEGASFEKKIKEVTNIRLTAYLTSLKKEKPFDIEKEITVSKSDQRTINDLRAKGIIVIPISQESNFVKAFFTNPKYITDKEVELLRPFKEQLVDLKLSHTSISDKAVKTVSIFTNLTSIELDYTVISDKSLAALRDLKRLTHINLVSTPITDKGLEELELIKSAREIYLYKTKITKKGFLNYLLKNPLVSLDTGNYNLKVLASDTIVIKRKK